MIIRIWADGTLQEHEIEGVAKVVVETDHGDTVMLSSQTAEGVVIAGHAGEKDFDSLLGKHGVERKRKPKVVQA